MNRSWREPFFLLFLLVTVVLIVLALANRSDETDTGATFAGARPTAAEAVTPVPLPTPEPSPTVAAVTAETTMSYTAEAIELAGSVPAQATADALIAAAAGLVGEDAVSVELDVVPEADAAASLLVLEGEVADDAERASVVEAFSDLGIPVADRLVIAGSDLTTVEAIAAADELSQLSDFIAAAGLADELADIEEPVTVFAPTDAAIEALDTAALTELAEVEQLAEVLRYHIVVGAFDADALTDGDRLTTLQGEELVVEVSDGTLAVGGAEVLTSDIATADGVIHIVDGVLLPGTLATEIALNRVVELDPVQFAAGSSDLLDESVPILEQAAAILVENPVGDVRIEGHTDSDGDEEVNLQLSQERAEAVLEFLVEAGVERDRLSAEGFGESRLLVDPDETAEDKARNRRIEFRVG